MSFREWAIQNPTLMNEYQDLLRELAQVLQDIREQEQIIEDAKGGIAPEERRSGLVMNRGLFSAYLLPSSSKRAIAAMMGQEYIPTPEDETKDEAFIIEQKKERHRQSLDKAVEDAHRELDGWVFDVSTFGNQPSSGDPKDIHVHEGLYDKKKRLEKEIAEFNSTDHVINWHTKKEDGLGAAIEQRLRVFGFRNVSYTTEGLLDYVIDDIHASIDDFHFELKYRAGWVVKLGDKLVNFTRHHYGETPVYPIQRALIAYLEYRWDYLIDILQIHIESEID